MGKCVYEGFPVPQGALGCCGRCSLYLDTCAPVIRNGFLAGAECDADYCEFCPAYGECSMYFDVEGGGSHAAAVS